MTETHLYQKCKEALTDYFEKEVEVTVKNVGTMLCGVNFHKALNPFSPEFLAHVAFNSKNSFYPLLWLQYRYTVLIRRADELAQASIEY